jgi:glycosyltransferase involved in cell wall biosynthesis
MRIIYVFTSLGIGGAERQGLALAGRMAARGHRVAVIVLRPRLAKEWPTLLPVIHLGMRKTPLSLLAGMAKGGRFLRKFHPELVHSHSFHANIVARLLKVFVPASTILSTVHSVYEGAWARMLAYRLTDCLSGRTTAVSEAAARRFVGLKAVPQQKCVVLSNGIDISEFAASAERRTQVRTRMVGEGEFVWLAAGRFVAAKDYPNLLRAFALLCASRSDARLWVAGETVGTEFDRVNRLAAELGVRSQLRWLGLRRDMPALFDAADGFVLGSAWEGMPLVVGEAMAMEKPVVVTDVGGVRELVGDCGLIVPSKAPSALAGAMLRLMRMPREDRHALGCAARERIIARFSMEARADEWEALYRRLLKPSR